MTKQETAEWLAENVLGWEFKGGVNPRWECFENKFEHGSDKLTAVWAHKLCKLIYSPDGFFAVIKAINVKDLTINKLSIIAKAWNNFFITLDYEAFYKAVYEAMK